VGEASLQTRVATINAGKRTKVRNGLVMAVALYYEGKTSKSGFECSS